MSTSIGMMDPAYFVGRKEILDWLNSYLGLDLQKVEETCTGAVACQLVDSLYPGKVPMSKVNWEARTDAEYIQNYKVLQSAFDRLHIDKHIDVQRLTRGKYMDNLEFMQWFKNFHDTAGAEDGYDAAARRSRGKGGAKFAGAGGGSSVGARRPSASARRTAGASSGPGTSKAGSRAGAGAGAGAGGGSRGGAAVGSSGSTSRANASPAPPQPDPALLQKVEDLTNGNNELQETLTATERERDFYFDKLRDIELLLQHHEAEAGGPSDFTKSAFEILYATDDDFAPPAEATGVEGGAAGMETLEETLAGEALEQGMESLGVSAGEVEVNVQQS